MANVFKSFLDSLRLKEDEDDEDDEYNSYAAKQLEREQRKSSRQSRTQDSDMYQRDMASTQMRQRYREPEEEYKSSSSYASYSDNRRDSSSKQDRGLSSKVVPIRTALREFEVCVMKPTKFEDSQDICDILLSNRAAVINLEGFDVDLAQRIMDFISGAVYSVNGRLHQISGYIFIVSPESIDISGDYRDVLAQTGFEVPTLNRDF